MFARKNILYCTKLLIILHSHLRKALSHAEIYSAKNKKKLIFLNTSTIKLPSESSVLGWYLSPSLNQLRIRLSCFIFFLLKYVKHRCFLYKTSFSLLKFIVLYGVTFNSSSLSPTSQQNNNVKKNKKIFFNSL